MCRIVHTYRSFLRRWMTMSAFRLSVSVLLFAGISGCSTSGQARTEKRAQSVKDYRAGLEKGSQQIDTTLKALDDVVAAAAADPRPAFKNFKAQLAILDDDASDSAARAEAMRARTAEYLDTWEEETLQSVKNPKLIKITEERRADARQKFQTLRDEAQNTRDLYRQFSRNLHEIEQTLDNDLNASGIDALKPVIREAKAQGKKVQAGIAKVLAEVKKVQDAMVPAGTEGAAPAA
jgi:hypothetical protein